MKRIMIAIATLGVTIGAAAAQNENSMNKTQSPGTTGAMSTPTAPGVATDPQQVQQQQGDSSRSSAGTVGAAPGADTQSQKPMDHK